jgi:hypothetical protein
MTLLAELEDHVRQRRGVNRREAFSERGTCRLIETHVERPCLSETESPFGVVELA